MLVKNLFGVYCAKTHVDNRDRCSKIAKRVEKIEALSRDKRSRTRSVAGIETGSEMNCFNGREGLALEKKAKLTTDNIAILLSKLLAIVVLLPLLLLTRGGETLRECDGERFLI